MLNSREKLRSTVATNRDKGDVNFMDHMGSNGLKASERITNAGYVWNAMGENIAAGQATVAAVMNGWLASPGHCANIMSSSFNSYLLKLNEHQLVQM